VDLYQKTYLSHCRACKYNPSCLQPLSALIYNLFGGNNPFLLVATVSSPIISSLEASRFHCQSLQVYQPCKIPLLFFSQVYAHATLFCQVHFFISLFFQVTQCQPSGWRTARCFRSTCWACKFVRCLLVPYIFMCVHQDDVFID
jgi:hypothetical protein